MAKKDKNKILMTQKGMEELQEELRVLLEVKRPKILDRMEQSRDMGDLSENSEYTAARQDLEFIDEQIAEIEEKLKNAEIVKKGKDKKTIEIGSTVTLKKGKKQVTYTIVGEGEADPREKKISHNSPLGKALLGKMPGDEVEVKAPVGLIKYKIVKVK